MPAGSTTSACTAVRQWRPQTAAPSRCRGLVSNLAPWSRHWPSAPGLNVTGPRAVVIGVGTASLEHAQSADYRTYLYVLANDSGGSNVIVEVSDVHGDKHPFDYERVMREFGSTPSDP
jgi:hypothetical protein